MSWIDTSSLSELEHYLDLTSYRQQLVANNLANIDTPGYHTRDILFAEEMDRADTSFGEEGGALQKPCQCRKAAQNKYLGRCTEADKRAETTVATAALGKKFRLPPPGQVSVNQ